ncbi:hypothetical protein BKA65DRAFT_205629 [Rhexocercosporidium sp. MPI-PUGE-AT-0058]|nr:hypothetical protein BKA65DRAFT_205629 [Rhexocercosporidium sp. MPI-PUGE-AT-0058]
MDLAGLANFLETQEIGFTSILKSTKNIDPTELKRTLTKHHAQMVMIAGGKYPIKLTPSTPNSPDKSAPTSNKRSFTSGTSNDDDYKPPTKTLSGSYSYTPKRNGSGSDTTPNKTQTPAKRKMTPTPSSSSSTRKFNTSGRMKPGGASNLFKNKSSNYSKSPSGFKTYDVIDLSSDVDSELEEAEEDSDIEGSDTQDKKKLLLVRKGVATRKITARLSKKASAAAAKSFIASLSDESDEEDPFSTKMKGESNREQKSTTAAVQKSKAEIERAAATISETKEKILILERSVDEAQATLSKTTHFLTRQGLQRKIESLKALISSNKLSIGEEDGSGSGMKEGEGRAGQNKISMVATVEDAPEDGDDNDSLFVDQTPVKDSAAKRRCGGF